MLLNINFASQELQQTGTKIIKFENTGYYTSKETLTSEAAALIMLTEVSAKRVHKDLIL